MGCGRDLERAESAKARQAAAGGPGSWWASCTRKEMNLELTVSLEVYRHLSPVWWWPLWIPARVKSRSEEALAWFLVFCSVISFCKLLGVISFVPEVRSWAGNDVPVNLYQTNVLHCEMKGHGPKAQFSPSKVPVLVKRNKILIFHSFRATSPYVPSCYCWQSQAPRTQVPLKLHSLPIFRMGKSCRLWPRQTATALRSPRQEVGRCSPLSCGQTQDQGWPWWGLWSPVGYPQAGFLCTPANPLAQCQGGWRVPGKEWDPTLISL